ncbi:28S ribosomal protein S22, mitochondrial [Venturia canescens]|uniref:28S ribosomal protein S22, mitochondrial n=1 Tax=Venturia canescens TaxID=32260 RepID=UPI001C9BF1E9|nr:28S ribosomal protein S22, mitochondrial [Venturia canescens]
MAGIGVQVIQSAGKTMISRSSYSMLRRAQYNIVTKSVKYSSNTHDSEKDPAPFFFNEDVQNLLKTLIRPNNEKLFRKRKDGKPIEDAVYKFMTDEELKKHINEADERGLRRLQMPPVVKRRTDIQRVLSKDPALQGHDTAKYVFTDITYPANDYQRLIAIREIDGTLRTATWDERHRINQIYYPIKGRQIRHPKMFQEEYLKDVLDRREYEFILDRACLQYEPNDPEYHRITETVYAKVNEEADFDRLRSTRHFGPLVFHLVWTKNINHLLLENIKTERLEDAVLLIKLYNTVHPDALSATLDYNGDNLKFLEDYISLEPSKNGRLVLSLQALKEVLNARQIIEEGVKKAHGL